MVIGSQPTNAATLPPGKQREGEGRRERVEGATEEGREIDEGKLEIETEEGKENQEERVMYPLFSSCCL